MSAPTLCLHGMYRNGVTMLPVIFSDSSKHWMTEMEEFFTPHLHIFLHDVYIFSTYIPSLCEHLLHLYAFLVCSYTASIFLHGMPIDLVTVIKKIQHNASFSLSCYAGGVSILLACGPNTTWFIPERSGWIFKIKVCMKNEDGTFQHSQIRPLHSLEMSGITLCHIPEHYKLLTSSFILSVASSWVLVISWICSLPSAFLIFVVFCA